MLWMIYQCMLFQINDRIAKGRLVTDMVIVGVFNYIKRPLLISAHISRDLCAVMTLVSGGPLEVIVLMSN